MITKHIKTAFRNIISQRSHSLINILGLSLGLAISLIIWIYVLQETSYDKFFNNYDQIFRIHSTVMAGTGEPQSVPTAMFQLAELAKNELPEIETFVRFNNFFHSTTITHEEKTVYVKDILMSDSTFFSVFDFKFLLGNPKTPLSQANSLVLTKSAAELLFENIQAALGQMVSLNENTCLITGIIEDIPENSHMKISGVMTHYDHAEGAKRSGYNWYTYFKIKPGSDLKLLAEKFDRIAHEQIIRENPMLSELNFTQKSTLMNIADIHLNSALVWEMKSNGNKQSLIIFIVLSIFILIAAIINFINLATARSMLRSKEIGVRKVVGANKASLIIQFMTESLMVTLIAFTIAMVITEIFGGIFSQNLGLPISTSILFSTQGILVMILMIFITAILSGLYPAFYLSSFNPIHTLKGTQVKGHGGMVFRKLLVVFQFAVTIILLSSLWVVLAQLRHMQHYNLGYDHEQVIVVRNVSRKISEAFPLVCAQLEAESRILETSGANFLFGGPNRIDMITEDGVTKESGVTADIITVSHNFLDLMEIELLDGRNFFASSEQDAQGAFILNETAVKALGFENPLDKHIDLFGRRGPLVGVIHDFHFKSLHSPIEPLAILFAQNGFPHIYVKVSPGNMNQALAEIRKVLNETDPAFIPEMIFLDETVRSFYEKEQTTSGLLTAGTFLAIIIALLGVYGLAAFSAERRIKEMGVRKVLGASLQSMLWLFNKESVMLVSIAFVMAVPVTWYFVEGWLDNFLIRVQLNPLWFVIPGLLVFIMSSLIISLQTWITSINNPVSSLRSE